MMLRRINLFAVGLGALSLSLSTQSARACAVCFGDPNSPMIQGAKAGAIFLGIVVYTLLMGIGAIVVTWTLRAKKLAAAEAATKMAGPPVPEPSPAPLS